MIVIIVEMLLEVLSVTQLNQTNMLPILFILLDRHAYTFYTPPMSAAHVVTVCLETRLSDVVK